MIEELEGLEKAIIKSVTSYTEEIDEYYDDCSVIYKLVIETNKGTFTYEGCGDQTPKIEFEDKKLYVVGKINSENIQFKDNYKKWEFQGIYDNEDKAVEECKDENYFVGPVKLNEKYPEKSVEWPGLYFPIELSKIDWNRWMGIKT